MCRTFIIVSALAMLSVSAANGTPDLSARPRSSTARVSTSHKAKHSSNHATGRTASTGRAYRSYQVRNSHRIAKSHRVRHAYPVVKSHLLTQRDATGRPVIATTSSRRTVRTAMPPPLRGSYASLERQNEKTENDNLERIEDDDDLADRIERKVLVPVPASASLTINGNLPENYRYCRPWTARFLTDLARVHATAFHRPLEISSAVRTVAYQKRLMETNGNAAAAEGDIASPHLTGATIDIVKQGMSRQEMAWMRSRLLRLEQTGMIDVEEEFQQSCFHITVYKSYLPPRPAVNGKPKRRKSPQPVQIVARAQ